MKRSLLIFLFATGLLGCDAASDMKDMLSKQEIVQSTIKEKYGWNTQVGFNFHNGSLTQVTLVLDASEVREEKVSRLQEIARRAIKDSFKSTPKVIFLQIASTPAKDS